LRRTALTTGTVAITIALAALLGGCSSSESPDPKPDQTEEVEEVEEVEELTIKQACAELGEASTEVGEALTAATSHLSDDPSAAAVAITEATATYEEAVGEIDNEEVRDAAEPLILGLTHFAEAIEVVAADPTAAGALEGVTDSSTEVNDALVNIGEICS
jgi:hypothetical protein